MHKSGTKNLKTLGWQIWRFNPASLLHELLQGAKF